MSFGFRFEGDKAEIDAAVEDLRAKGYQVRVGGSRLRGEGFWHVYGELTAPGTTPPKAEPGPTRATVRTAVAQGRALPPGRRSRGF